MGSWDYVPRSDRIETWHACFAIGINGAERTEREKERDCTRCGWGGWDQDWRGVLARVLVGNGKGYRWDVRGNVVLTERSLMSLCRWGLTSQVGKMGFWMDDALAFWRVSLRCLQSVSCHYGRVGELGLRWCLWVAGYLLAAHEGFTIANGMKRQLSLRRFESLSLAPKVSYRIMRLPRVGR